MITSHGLHLRLTSLRVGQAQSIKQICLEESRWSVRLQLCIYNITAKHYRRAFCWYLAKKSSASLRRWTWQVQVQEWAAVHKIDERQLEENGVIHTFPVAVFGIWSTIKIFSGILNYTSTRPPPGPKNEMYDCKHSVWLEFEWSCPTCANVLAIAFWISVGVSLDPFLSSTVAHGTSPYYPQFKKLQARSRRSRISIFSSKWTYLVMGNSKRYSFGDAGHSQESTIQFNRR